MILKQPEGDNDGSGQEENKKTWHDQLMWSNLPSGNMSNCANRVVRQ